MADRMASSDADALIVDIVGMKRFCESKDDVIAMQALLPLLLSDDMVEVVVSARTIIEIVCEQPSGIIPLFHPFGK